MPDTRRICHVHRKDAYRRGPGKLLEVMGSVRDPAGGKDPPAVSRILPHEFQAETAIGARYHDRGHSTHLVWSRSPAGHQFVNEDPVRSITRWRAHDRIFGHRAGGYARQTGDRGRNLVVDRPAKELSFADLLRHVIKASADTPIKVADGEKILRARHDAPRHSDARNPAKTTGYPRLTSPAVAQGK